MVTFEIERVSCLRMCSMVVDLIGKSWLLLNRKGFLSHNVLDGCGFDMNISICSLGVGMIRNRRTRFIRWVDMCRPINCPTR